MNKFSVFGPQIDAEATTCIRKRTHIMQVVNVLVVCAFLESLARLTR